ncbi:hypothetical protein H8B13_11450 [Hymenobacter sp. BT188]|uniref:glycoside hydrolase family 113 n=1 Tax=Hymenobacter sp. BT188 TaxID=2763504 RepID=UPI0016513009|nr:hypothetical protein [Hymenobacter sp. BT188]MBC6607434.1 hypothetical protein [Hymenobacter sp. BT188]
MPNSLLFRRWWALVPLLTILGLVTVLAAGWWWPRTAPSYPIRAATARFSIPANLANRMRGVSWVGSDSITDVELAPLQQHNVTWIAQTPFGWQRGATSPTIGMNTGRGRVYWGESDAGLIQTAQLARKRGQHILLKPHLWVRGDGTWPGDIRMTSDADWKAWFQSYTTFILHYAELAEQQKLDGLCIGTELEQTTTAAHETEWRALIQQIRQVYHGPLTYAANWSGEYEHIRFWDALDYIGIQAYFPLTKNSKPTKAELLAGWQPHLKAIERVQKRFNKPVVFTEMGYKCTPDAAVEPWVWPDRTTAFLQLDEGTQAACYAAMFETFWSKRWFGGLFVWKWYPKLAADGPARRHADFTPQHKEAAQVMAQWFGK